LSVSLYRKYRPTLFREVAGQDIAIGVLRSSYAEGKMGHAYLFSGPRGCGKTTVARLLAKIVNCQNPTADGEPCCICDSCAAVSSGSHMDVMEIDGASNRGIDQIRELKSHVGLASFMGGAKVYILDEVHMLTTEAFNALLKTLEEPPPLVMFVFATTEPHKVPVTIRSRCQHIPFHRISTECMVAQLHFIAGAEGVSASDSALWEISRNADGALRDAISLFEQAIAISHGEVSQESVRALFGGGSRAETERWVTLARERPEDAAAMLKETLDLGVSPERFLDGLFPLLRDMWAFSLWGEKAFAGTSLSSDEKDFLKTEVPNWRADVLKRAAMAVAALFPRARLGLRNDVFSGLLLFEMLNSFETSQVKAASAPPVPVEPKSSLLLPARKTAAKERKSAEPEITPSSAGEPEQSSDEMPISGVNEILSRIARDDLMIASAMIDVKVLREGDSLKLDFSDAAKVAEVALTGTRAGSVLESAFGIPPGGSYGESGQEYPNSGDDVMTLSAKLMNEESPMEAIAARLGADILMSRRLDAADNGAGDIEDELF